MSTGAVEGPAGGSGPLEYVLVTVPSAALLGGVAAAVLGDEVAAPVGVVDAVVLERPAGRAAVTVREAADVEHLERLAAACDRRVLFSEHDADLVGVTLEPGEVALLLLVEDRWARRLTHASRAAGGHLGGGEWVVRGVPDGAARPLGQGRARAGRPDLLARRPLAPDDAAGPASMDQVEQLRALAELVDRGLLDAAQYEVQRRRALDD